MPDFEGRDPKTGKFVAGNARGGRPKGSRNKLGEQFLSDLQADWAENGAETLARVRQMEPGTYVKVVASILPRELNVNHNVLEDFSTEQLENYARLLEEIATGDSGAGDGAKAFEGDPARTTTTH